MTGFKCHRDDALSLGFVVEGGKLNGRGFLHAGVIAAVADAAIGHSIGAPMDPSARLVTVNLSCDLLGSARRDEWVDVDVDVTKRGRRIGAGTATLRVADRVVAVVTARVFAA